MKIPNKLLELSRNELMVACRLYSIVNRHTKLTTNGYAVCIKQETIAASCGLSGCDSLRSAKGSGLAFFFERSE